MQGEQLRKLLEPLVSGLGFELLEVIFRSGSNGLLRLYIDHPEGIGLDDCERVSEQVSAMLDVEDPIPGHYTLEVSSPGDDRVLNRPAHFERFAGERIKVRLKMPRDGRRRFTGTLKGVDRGEVLMEVDSEAVRLPLESIERARLAPLG